MKYFLCILIFSLTILSHGQEGAKDNSEPPVRRFLFGIQAGTGWAYEDEAHLFNTAAGLTLDYHIANNFYIQFAPAYFWVWKWNEHYLSLPIHLRKKFGRCISLFAGPALTFDIGHFKDLGISAGVYMHYTSRSALAVSVTAFNLYDYQIDYLYVPITISYHITL